MRIKTKTLSKLPYIVVTAVLGVFSAQTLVLNLIDPAHQAGIVDVTVRTLHGSVTLYQSYTFIDLPDVPNTGHERP
ncbi:hypothetical protein FWD07_02695 [Candidatus Saccharibacteria bacterium]|nr:hypothetical protein [Candidatus Saccharibacteria bacterium]